ncbi:MAG: hypothetical protein M1833_003207 [Piccolia ochrophora]|nr:MAG: hypothetical protein M1833_003207 [Piccolia ochrophora]
MSRINLFFAVSWLVVLADLVVSHVPASRDTLTKRDAPFMTCFEISTLGLGDWKPEDPDFDYGTMDDVCYRAPINAGCECDPATREVICIPQDKTPLSPGMEIWADHYERCQEQCYCLISPQTASRPSPLFPIGPPDPGRVSTHSLITGPRVPLPWPRPAGYRPPWPLRRPAAPASDESLLTPAICDAIELFGAGFGEAVVRELREEGWGPGQLLEMERTIVACFGDQPAKKPGDAGPSGSTSTRPAIG